jgi:hypothetical protein
MRVLWVRAKKKLFTVLVAKGLSVTMVKGVYLSGVDYAWAGRRNRRNGSRTNVTPQVDQQVYHPNDR